MAEAWRDFQDRCSIDRASFKIVRVSAESPSASIGTRVHLSTLGSHTSGTLLEHHVEMMVGWDPANRIATIESLFYQEVALESREPLFEDCTQSVLGDCPSFESILRPGLDHWAARIHNQVGMASEGYQGIAIGDVDGDGMEDLYLCQPGGLPNQLFLQNPDGSLREAPKGHGADWLERSRSALIADLDNDGDRDLVVLCNTHALVMANDGNGTFARTALLKMNGSPFSCALADYDLDGDLDLYVCNYGDLWGGFGDLNERFPLPYHDANNGGPNALFRNDGDLRFSNVTTISGLHQNNTRWSLACAWEDFDKDGDQDLYVANDFGRNCLYRNDGGTFTDIAPQAEVEDLSPGMSVSWGDANRDGWMDLYVSNMFSGAGNRITPQSRFMPGASATTKGHFQRFARGNTLYLNRPGDAFHDASEETRVSVGRWAWSSRFSDFNNDGFEDIVVANGFLTQEDTEDL